MKRLYNDFTSFSSTNDLDKIQILESEKNYKEALAVGIQGNLFYQEGKYQEALAKYDEAIELDPNEVTYRKNKALTLSIQGIKLHKECKFREAITKFDKAIELDSNHPEYRKYKALILNDEGGIFHNTSKYNEAIGKLDEAIELDPNNTTYYNNKASAIGMQGSILHQNGQYQEAIVKFDEAIKLNPHFQIYYYNKASALAMQGSILHQNGKYQEAIIKLDEALWINPGELLLLHNKALVLCDLAVLLRKDAKNKEAAVKLDEAIDLLDKIIKLDPNNEVYRHSKASALFDQGEQLKQERKYKEAIAKYDEAIKLNPNEVTYSKNKSFLLRKNEMKSGKNQDAIFSRILEETTKLNRNNQNNLDKADTLFGEGKYMEALPYYENLIKNNPNDIKSLSMKGTILIFLHEYEKAIQCYDTIISIKPFGENAFYLKNKEADCNYNKGNAFKCIKNYEMAIKCYDKVLTFNNKDIECYFAKARSLKELGKYKEAIECCEKIRKIDPQETQALCYKNKLIKYLNGEEDLEKVPIKPKYDKKDTEAMEYNQEGLNLMDNLKMHKEAIKYFDKAIAISPKLPGPYQNKGDALRMLGMFNTAIEFYDKAIEINPKYLSALNNKGICLTMLGKFTESLEFYKKAIILDPNDSQLYSNFGIVYFNLKKYSLSIVFYDKALMLNPECHETCNLKGLALCALNKFEEAIEFYDRFITLQPHNPEGYYNKCETLGSLNRFGEAAVCYAKAMQLEYDGLYDQASSYQAQGLWDEAIKLFDNLIKIDSNHHNFNEGTFINKLLCTVYKNNPTKDKLTEEKIVDTIFDELNSVSKLPELAPPKEEQQLIEKVILSTEETSQNINNVSVGTLIPEEQVSSNKNKQLAKENFLKNKIPKFKANVTKQEIKNFIFPQDYITNKYTIELKFEHSNKIKNYEGYKLDSRAIGGYQYWGVVDIDLKKDSDTQQFIKVLNNSVYNGINSECSTGIKYINNSKKTVYEVKIQADARLYTSTVAKSSLNKVIVFDHLGNHTSVKNFLNKSNNLEIKVEVKNIDKTESIKIK